MTLCCFGKYELMYEVYSCTLEILFKFLYQADSSTHRVERAWNGTLEVDKGGDTRECDIEEVVMERCPILSEVLRGTWSSLATRTSSSTFGSVCALGLAFIASVGVAGECGSLLAMVNGACFDGPRSFTQLPPSAVSLPAPSPLALHRSPMRFHRFPSAAPGVETIIPEPPWQCN